VHGGPTVLILDLGDAGRRSVDRAQPVGAEPKGGQDDQACDDRVGDQDHGLAFVLGHQLGQAPGNPRGDLVHRLPTARPNPPWVGRPGLGLLGKAHRDFGPGQPGPGPEVHLAEGRLQADGQLVRRGNRLRRGPGALQWARVDRTDEGAGERAADRLALATPSR
jgi:hypothetical protein